MTDPKDRRSAPRLSVQLPLSIAETGGTLVAEVHNLSASGVYFTLDRFVAPMSKLELAFELPDGARKTAVRCGGVVVRAEPVMTPEGNGRYRIAVFFNDLSEKDRQSISRFVQHRLSNQTVR